MKQVIAVVGLGLLGGSLSAALRGFEDFEVVGVARRQETVDYALAHGVCDRATLDAAAALAEADVTVLCTEYGFLCYTHKRSIQTDAPFSLLIPLREYRPRWSA